MISNDPFGFAVITVAMMLAVYATRAGGYWLIGRITIGPRLRKMFDALPGAVIAATIAPTMINGGISAWAAAGVALVVMIVTRKDVLAIFAGIAATAAVRFAGF